jgi:hypothetical protein
MASTYSTNLAIELIGTGDQAGSWGNTTNTNLGTLIEQAISGYVTQAVSTGTDTTITIPNGATGVARNMYIELTGTGGASTNLIVPANKKLYFIFNNTSSGQVTVKVSGQTGVSVPNKAKIILVSNGTDVVDATNYIGNISAASANITVLTSASATITNLIATSASITTLTNNPTFSGGTANGVLYLNGSKVATSGSALTFDGTNLGVAVTPSAWGSIFRAVQVGTGGSIFGRSSGNQDVFQMGANVFWDGSNWKYIGNGASTRYEQATGTHVWSYAASGTAGDTITFTEAMTLNASGNLGIGTSSPAYKLDVNTGQIRANESSTGSGDGGLIAGTVSANGNAGVLFQTNGASRWNITTLGTNGASLRVYNYALASTVATFDSSGNLGLGVTPSAWGTTKALEFSYGAFSANSSLGTDVSGNCYYNGTNWIYRVTGVALRYNQATAGHSWHVASGTAGDAISFTQAMTLDASSNLFVGGTTGSAKLNLQTTTNSSSDSEYIRLYNAGENVGYISWINGNGDLARITGTKTGGGASANDGILTFSTALDASLTERARITSGGDFLTAGKTTASSTTVGAELLANGQINTASANIDNLNLYNTTAAAYRFYVSPGGTVFATNTTISAISDQRLKENVRDLDVGLDAIMALKPRKFDWKEGKGQDKKDVRGFIAQEFEQVFPDLIDEWKDPAPEGEEPYKSVRQDLIPVLVKAIQELSAKVAALEAK